MVNSKHAFWQALVFTVIVFGIGVLIGFSLEGYRFDKSQLNLINSEINILDEQVRNRIVEDFNVSCELAKESLFVFADDIYQEALQLEDYDSASKFTNSLFVLHKRYDLLRTILWAEAVKLKKDCEEDFHTVVYLYNYGVVDIDVRSRQLFYSRLLFDLKQKDPDNVLLIPIAINMNLASVDLAVENYGVEKFPSILIDENEIVDDATFNIIGENSIRAALETGMISKEEVGKVQGIPFALVLL